MESSENARHEYEVYRKEAIQTIEVNEKLNFFEDQLQSAFDDIKEADGYLYLD